MQPDPMVANLRKGVVEHCVLAVLRDDEVYGVDLANDQITWVEPREGKAGSIPLVASSDTPNYFPQKVTGPSPYYGEDVIWKAQANPHNPMMDQPLPLVATLRTILAHWDSAQ